MSVRVYRVASLLVAIIPVAPIVVLPCRKGLARSPLDMCRRLTGVTMMLIAFSLAAGDRLRAADAAGQPNARLVLDVRDAADGRRTPARFSLLVNGREYVPESPGPHGLRFTSVHESRRQVQTITYVRGTGPVEFALPGDARQVEVRVAKGFEYLPATVTRDVTAPLTRVDVTLARWANLGAEGWFAADEHVHYDRLDRAANADWLTMMAGDDLSHVHFMMLKGGQVPGEWAKQYGYGSAGEGTDGERLMTAGEEYRDSAQGHINLLAVREIIQPVQTGTKDWPDNYPPLHTVLRRARELGAFNGVAHGGSAGTHATAIVDTVLGMIDFFEIANPFNFAPNLWYQLMNCGYHLPPAAGTDLPNYPFRDGWQPFLGSMRMYVGVGAARDFATWRHVVARSEVFITAGPLLSFKVNNRTAGSDVLLTSADEVAIDAEIASPIGLREFELIVNGQPVAAEIEKAAADGVQRWRLRQRLRIDRSSWLAVRGVGVSIDSLKRPPGPPARFSDAVAHSSAIRVLVGGAPIRSASDCDALLKTLDRQREFYRRQARYSREAQREEMLRLLDRAIVELETRRREAQSQ